MVPRRADDPSAMAATSAPTSPGWTRRPIDLANAAARSRVAIGCTLGLLAASLAAFGWRGITPEAGIPPFGAWQQRPTSSVEAATGDNASGTVTGRIAAEGGARIPEMVVYLETVDPEKSYAATTGPASISQKGAQFSPSLLVICAGQQVDFLNDEDRPVEHNVFSNSPAKPFDLGLYPPRGSKLVTFDRPGAVSLHCSIHQNMDGVIFVAPTPFFARVDHDTGSYTIAGVPPGEYRLRTWQRVRRFTEHTASVTVKGRSAVRVDILLSRS
jgi:plastocyanin